MTAIEKFKFTLNFDDADTVIRPAGAQEEHYSLKRKSKKKTAEEEAPPPPPAIYTEEQMQTMLRDTETRAREEAFAQGHQEGLTQGREEILSSLEKAVSDTAAQIAAWMNHIDELQKRAHASTAEDAIHVTQAIVKKLLPVWMSENSTAEIEQIIRQSLSNLFDAPKVLIQVHPEIADSLQDRVAEIARSRGFSGQAVVVGEASIAKGDCRVSWGDGTAVRDQARTWGEINAIIEKAIAAHREAHDLLDQNPMADPALQESRLPDEDINTGMHETTADHAEAEATPANHAPSPVPEQAPTQTAKQPAPNDSTAENATTDAASSPSAELSEPSARPDSTASQGTGPASRNDESPAKKPQTDHNS
ncbi:FliH/SctL family protein [Thalassospira sp. TSL5-1]|uniref:FliH/SctL family protein n=1 Tax=Thalassospira sp. TSL5-1 TaxID=1544451 RepID=UPI00093FF1C2|nr:FliH/SctL family protein [Thalassospira sp. TSL5-1]OKH89013.1 hypothetical protein LF95_02820 [Thalassospira sp. TSL5-1]